MRMFCWVTLLALVQGCSLLKADYQMWENDKTMYFTGIVETDHEAHGPLVVVLYKKGVQPVPVYINVIPRQRGVYHLGVPGDLATGSYGIVAFEDVDEDTQYSTGDPFSVYSGKALPVSAINDPPSESEGLGHIVIAGTSVNAVPPPVFGEAYDALLKRREQSFGGQVSIGQSRFDAAQVREGMFQPLKFVSEGQVGLFMLQPFDPGKVPVVFVHGIGGSPRDWIDVIANLDREHFQPWVAYYPSGASIGYSALMLSSAMNELRYRHPGGWAFYIKDGKLAGAHNYLDVEHYEVKSSQTVPAGEHELRMTFAYEGGKEAGQGGTLKLLVDGRDVGSGKVAKTSPFKYSLSENQDIGSDTGTPVTYDYTPPFNFTGTLNEVVVELTK